MGNNYFIGDCRRNARSIGALKAKMVLNLAYRSYTRCMDISYLIAKKEIISYVFTLRKLHKQFHILLKEPLSVEGQFELDKISKEMKKMSQEGQSWSEFKNRVYMEVFPQIPQIS